MRRLISSRPVRLALLAALVAGAAAGLVLAARRRRAAAPVRPSGAAEPEGGSGDAEDRRGPEPVLGWAAEEDLERYRRPEGGAPVFRLLGGLPPVRGLVPPRGTRARRWTAAAVVSLGLLALGGQVLENAVFGPDAWTSYEPCPADACEPGQGDAFLSAGFVDDGACPAAGCEAPGAVYAEDGEPVTADGGDPMTAEPETSPDPRCVLHPARRGTPAVRPVSRRVTSGVNRQWRRIERWLKAHAPRTYASLNGPAAPRLVARAEARIGTRLPDSLRASLLRHDGSHGGASFRLPPYFLMMGTRETVAAWPEACGMGGGVPVAYADDFGDYLVTDAATGGVGEASPEQSYYQADCSSYYALLKATADALTRGATADGFRPVVHGGVLDWTSA
ncbi:hypothetical protein F5972_08980 [Microbispora cellulosiformans]|uniref:Knr4/Smi1-like domain-containing protein n=1 Tax=Microbispora cellulosiformans TaxID=2614688 RepID=A0A5J5K5F4_9ACTN|nr:hypothetical protein [Microbispora cellulosiformans]KAA9379766.1 hypothetical protein F5972_08980 [Microbispora cellulosiformans]